MSPNELALQHLLDTTPSLSAVWFDDPKNPKVLYVAASHNPTPRALSLPKRLADLDVQYIHCPPIRILRAPATTRHAANPYQQCQNEPIKLGTQVQPAAANWLGTAGAPISFTDTKGNRCWGLLSNWHVIADGDQRIGRTIHQPNANSPAIARLSRWCEPNAQADNLCDCAVADALIDGRHTIANEILDLGRIGQTPLDARPSLNVTKIGRTTGRTTGRCIGVGAAVNVGYDGFVARFIDQDVFEADSGEFSAPGDSGSLILGASCKCPTALLFAGSSKITIGNPIRHVIKIMSLIFPFT